MKTYKKILINIFLAVLSLCFLMVLITPLLISAFIDVSILRLDWHEDSKFTKFLLTPFDWVNNKWL